jgi:hypothetical protein
MFALRGVRISLFLQLCFSPLNVREIAVHFNRWAPIQNFLS